MKNEESGDGQSAVKKDAVVEVEVLEIADEDTVKPSTSTSSTIEDAEAKRRRMDALLNRKRKATSGEASSSKPSTVADKPAEDERTVAKREAAKEKILWEAKRAKARVEQYGPQGWLRPKSLSTNKEFLTRTLQSTLSRREKRDK